MPLPFIPIIAAVAAKGAAVAGTVLASKAALGVGAAIIAAVVVGKITKDVIREKARERARELSRRATEARIKKLLREGDYKVVKIGLCDDNQNEVGELEMKGDDISSDIRVGMVIGL